MVLLFLHDYLACPCYSFTFIPRRTASMPLPDFNAPGQGEKAPIPGAGMPINPVEMIQKNHMIQSETDKLRQANIVYGQHAPLRMMMERNFLAQHRRLPGLKSNLLDYVNPWALMTTLSLRTCFTSRMNAQF